MTQQTSPLNKQSISTADSTNSKAGAMEARIGLWPLTAYFLRLGTVGFGGPVALAGFMHRDLVERRQWITEDTYKLSLAPDCVKTPFMVRLGSPRTDVRH